MIDQARRAGYNLCMVDSTTPSDALLTTKLYAPPNPSTFVPRSRLMAQLDFLLHPPHALALIVAPVGFGKSSLAAAWCRAQPVATAWLSLDADDNDPQRFFLYLLAALQSALPNRAAFDEIQLLARSPHAPPLPTLINLLINLLEDTLAEPIVLVLDDYHVLDAALVQEGTQRLIEFHPLQLRILMTTRVDPPLPLARWRARGILLQLRQEDLKFTSTETLAFLNERMELALEPAQLVALETRTEGWVAGLQLAALSLRGQSDATRRIQDFTGSHRYIFDYLVEEVLRQQPAAHQTFLLQTSLLSRLCAGLCDAVTQRADSQTFLQEMERANLFMTALDETREWFRYHRLFADVLQKYLHQAMPQQVPELHRRAGEWFAANHFFPEAIGHAFAAQDIPRAAEWIAQAAEGLFKRGEHTTLYRWLDQLPETELAAHPALNLARARALIGAHELARAAACVQQMETAFASQSDERSRAQRARAQAARVQILSRQNAWHQIAPLAREALDALPPEEQYTRGLVLNHLGLAYLYQEEATLALDVFQEAYQTSSAAGDWYAALFAFANRAEIFWMRGQLADAAVLYREILNLVQVHGLRNVPTTSRHYASWGDILYEQNDLAGAEINWQHAFELAAQGSDPYFRIMTLAGLAKLSRARGDKDSARALLARAQLEQEQHQVPFSSLAELERLQVRCWLETQDPAASRWAKTNGLGVESELGLFKNSRYRTLVRVWLAEGRAREAVNLLERLRVFESAGGWVTAEIETLLLLALANHQNGDWQSAQRALERALEMGAAAGFLRTFIDEGEALADLLTQLQLTLVKTRRSPAQERVLAFAHQLLTHMRGAEVRVDAAADAIAARATATGLLEPLTARERQVMELLAKGYTNQQICETLIISLGTTKKHLANIFGKLNVPTRTQALLRARELGLL